MPEKNGKTGEMRTWMGSKYYGALKKKKKKKILLLIEGYCVHRTVLPSVCVTLLILTERLHGFIPNPTLDM